MNHDCLYCANRAGTLEAPTCTAHPSLTIHNTPYGFAATSGIFAFLVKDCDRFAYQSLVIPDGPGPRTELADADCW